MILRGSPRHRPDGLKCWVSVSAHGYFFHQSIQRQAAGVPFSMYNNLRRILRLCPKPPTGTSQSLLLAYDVAQLPLSSCGSGRNLLSSLDCLHVSTFLWTPHSKSGLKLEPAHHYSTFLLFLVDLFDVLANE